MKSKVINRILVVFNKRYINGKNKDQMYIYYNAVSVKVTSKEVILGKIDQVQRPEKNYEIIRTVTPLADDKSII